MAGVNADRRSPGGLGVDAGEERRILSEDVAYVGLRLPIKVSGD